MYVVRKWGLFHRSVGVYCHFTTCAYWYSMTSVPFLQHTGHWKLKITHDHQNFLNEHITLNYNNDFWNKPGHDPPFWILIEMFKGSLTWDCFEHWILFVVEKEVFVGGCGWPGWLLHSPTTVTSFLLVHVLLRGVRLGRTVPHLYEVIFKPVRELRKIYKLSNSKCYQWVCELFADIRKSSREHNALLHIWWNQPNCTFFLIFCILESKHSYLLIHLKHWYNSSLMSI